MSHPAVTRSEYVQALPKLSDAADLIGLDPSGITRAVRRLEIEPLPWGARDKHLTVTDVLRIAASAQRASLEEVAGNLLAWAEREHPDHVEAFKAEIDTFFAKLPPPTPSDPNTLIADLHATLPKRWADKAERIWREHATPDTHASNT